MSSHHSSLSFSPLLSCLGGSLPGLQDFNLVLQRYAAERFLYRLSLSTAVDRFTLKGKVFDWIEVSEKREAYGASGVRKRAQESRLRAAQSPRAGLLM